MSTSERSVNSGTVAFDSAIRRAMTCWMRVSSCDRDVALRGAGLRGRRRGRGRAACGWAGPSRRGLGAARGRGRCRVGWRRCGRLGGRVPEPRGAGLRGLLDVGLHDPAAGSGSVDEVQVDALLASHAAGERRGLDAPGLRARRGAAAGAAGGAAPAARRRGGRGLRRRARAAAAAAASAAARAAAAAGAARPAGAAAPAPSSSRAMTSPIGSVSPAATTIVSTPAASDSYVSVALSVSISAIGSPRLTDVAVGLQPLEDRAFLHRVRQPWHDDLGHRAPIASWSSRAPRR